MPGHAGAYGDGVSYNPQRPKLPMWFLGNYDLKLYLKYVARMFICSSSAKKISEIVRESAATIKGHCL